MAKYEKCLKFNAIKGIVVWLAALIDAGFDNLLRPHYHPVVACVFDRCRHWSEMARPMSYHDGVVGSSYHTLVLNVQCFSLSTLKNQGYSCTHWHHGISHDPQVLPIWAVWKILCAEYDEESIGISIGLGKCAKGELFCLSNDDDAQCV